MERRACIGRNRIPGSDRVIAVALRSLVPQELYYYSTTTTYEFNWALFMAIIIHLKVVKGLLIRSRALPPALFQSATACCIVSHAVGVSLSLCVCVERMAGVRGILRQRQETRRVGPWMCAPSLPCMCTRRLLGLVDRSRTGSDPSCWGWGWGSPLLAARHMAPSATVPLGHAH